eukprot:snap_masked-scaffold_4-processed-gene-5.29-mRNA-1 protein AED:1.00 eAED:1.00 QI:0/-1/0/0/-1/1/1/0/63
MENCDHSNVLTTNGVIQWNKRGDVTVVSEDGVDIELKGIFFYENMLNLISIASLNQKDFLVIF